MPDIDDVFNLLNPTYYLVKYSTDLLGGFIAGIPGMQELKNWILTVRDIAQDAVNRIAIVQTVLTDITNLINNQFGGLFGYLNFQFATVLNRINDLTDFATDILTVITNLPQWMIDFLTQLMLAVKTIIELATRIFTTNIAKLTDMAVSTTVGMTAIVQSLIQSAINELGNALITLKGVLDTVMLQLTDVLRSLVQDVVNVMNTITKIIIENQNKLLDAGLDGSLRIYKAAASARITALAASVAAGLTYRLALTQ